MSAVVKTVTPFISQEILLKALDCLQVSYTIANHEIMLTEHKDFRGKLNSIRNFEKRITQ